MVEALKNKVVLAFLWKFLEKSATSILSIVITIILARLLFPEDYAVVALIAVFISISEILINGGFNTALIQKKNISNVDLSSVFYISLLTALLIYIILFLIAPFIAEFYNIPLICPVLRVLGLSLFFGAINSVQRSIISRNFLFKKLFYCTLGALILSGSIGIVMALIGFGVWALVAQQLTSTVTICFIMWITVRWRPKLEISLIKIKELFSFGWKILAAGIVFTLYSNLTTILIGKLYPTNMLGYYTKGKEYPTSLITAVDSTIQEVLLPTFSRLQDNKDVARKTLHTSLISSTYIIFPIMAGFAAVAEPFVSVFLTDKWLPAVPFIQIFCLLFATYPLQSVNHRAYVAFGKSGCLLKHAILLAIFGSICIVCAIPFGVYVMTIALLFREFLAIFIYSYPNKRLLGYSVSRQLKDVLPAALLSLIMAGITYSIIFIGLPGWLTLLIQIPLGIVIYFGLSQLLKLEAFIYIRKTMREYLSRT